MALANIFSKLNDLENRFHNISPDISPLNEKITDLENKINKLLELQNLSDRLAIIESLNIPTAISDLQNKVNNIENKVTDTSVFLNKLNDIENVTITDLKKRVTILEEKFLS